MRRHYRHGATSLADSPGLLAEAVAAHARTTQAKKPGSLEAILSSIQKDGATGQPGGPPDA